MSNRQSKKTKQAQAAVSAAPATDANLPAEVPPEEVTETADQGKYPNRFKPGQSGNPSGRPKMTKVEKDTLEKIKGLAPLAYTVMVKILNDPKASYYAKIQVITIILNRAYGLPESSVKLMTSQQSMEDSAACIQAMVARIRIAPPNEEGETAQ